MRGDFFVPVFLYKLSFICYNAEKRGCIDMTDRQQALINEFLEQINPSYRDTFARLAEHSVSLGYNPVRNKTQNLSIDFRNSKLKKTIMKFDTMESEHDGFKYGERDVPGLRLKFFASTDYSDIFSAGVKRVIEAYGGKYTGCYGCGRCGGKPQGYVYTYPDGKKVFRCGSELVGIFNYTGHEDEICSLMTRQAEYYSERAEQG